MKGIFVFPFRGWGNTPISSALFDRPEGGLSAEDSYGIAALAKASADSVGFYYISS